MIYFKQFPFSYLKVIEFDPTVALKENNYKHVFSLTCVIKSSVHIQYADNSNYTISFDIFNDGSRGFKAIRAGSIIQAADQLFVIQTITKKYNGAATATVTASQVVNAWIDRLQQNKPLLTTLNDDDSDSDNGSSLADDSNKIAHVNLDQLLDWFQDGINLYMGAKWMHFNFHVCGWFPVRPIKNPKHWSGKQLFTQITQAWPGTVIIGMGFDIYIFGYKQYRDKNGDLVNVLNNWTGQRFDAMANAKNVEVTTDMSRMCNAIEVKSATYSRQSSDTDDGEDDGEEFVNQNVPYFKNFVASSERSIQKYGLYASPDVLDNGFTNRAAALQAAREKMVLEPVVSVTAEIDHPGTTELCPSPGDVYTIGISNEHTVYHVVVRGYDWYPMDSAKGCKLTLNNVDPGIIKNLKETIIHDAELSPTITNFKMLSDDDSSDDGDTDDDGSDTEQGDTGLEQVDSDKGTDRPDDDNKSSTQTLPSVKAHLPIYSVGPQAGVTYKGNIVVNKNNKQWMVRQAISDDDMNALKSGKIKPEDLAKKHMMDRIFMIDFDHGKWLHGKNINLNSSYQNSNFYFGHTTLFGSGLIATQANQFTFRANVPNSDYQSDGTMRHEVAYYDDNGTGIFVDTRSGVNPGHMARVNTGPIYSTSRHELSRLSTKKDVKKLDEGKAINRIMQTDIGEYRYNKEYDSEQNYEASVIIDDVNDKPKWRTPNEFKDKTGSYRNDSSLLAYAVVVVKSLVRNVSNVFNKVKSLTKRVNKLEAENQQLKQEIEDIKKQLNN